MAHVDLSALVQCVANADNTEDHMSYIVEVLHQWLGTYSPKGLLMRLLSFLSVLSFALFTFQQNVDVYVQSETPIAKAGMLANIGPTGSKSSGAAAGIVIASPSTTNPNYLFTWTRDSSLVRTVL